MMYFVFLLVDKKNCIYVGAIHKRLSREGEGVGCPNSDVVGEVA